MIASRVLKRHDGIRNGRVAVQPTPRQLPSMDLDEARMISLLLT